MSIVPPAQLNEDNETHPKELRFYIKSTMEKTWISFISRYYVRESRDGDVNSLLERLENSRTKHARVERMFCRGQIICKINHRAGHERTLI